MKALHALFHPYRPSQNLLSGLRTHPPPSLTTSQPRPSQNLPLLTRQPTSPFSTSSSYLARKKQGPKRDQRISIIRYHLQHPINPRPLRFSRGRHLRHWTIHRAWQLYRAKLRNAQQLGLERQYNSMRAACEALRQCGEDGLSIAESASPGASDMKAGVDVQAAAERQKEVGKLFRVAMLKGGIWDGVPIEYARCQTETPPRAGWDHAWTR